MADYHLSLALAHWTSRPELQGKRDYHYRNAAWLLALAHCITTGPFSGKHRGHVSHERIADFMPAFDVKRSGEIAAFWKKLGAIKVHGFNARGTDYEIVMPAPEDLAAPLAVRHAEAARADYLARPYEAPKLVEVEPEEKPRKAREKGDVETWVDAEKRRAFVLEDLMPKVESNRRRSLFAEWLSKAARTTLAYKGNPKIGRRAAEVEAAIDFVQEHGWTFAEYAKLCRWVANDPDAPSETRWLFTDRLAEYRERCLAAMRLAPAVTEPEPAKTDALEQPATEADVALAAALFG